MPGFTCGLPQRNVMKIAIYSRKSKFTGKGESIDNQVEMCKEYAEKYFGPSEYFIYEDEGFTAANTNRRSFQQMLQDARNKKFEILMCYRLDRISRNIADFSALMEEIQGHSISFISIREQFDTSTPLGRAMMYIASVFAQLERETIAERVRDNMHELAKTGRWLGGTPPMGFQSERITYVDDEFKERTLVRLNPIENEMKEVELIFYKYLETGSMHKLRKYLVKHNKKTKNNAYYSLRTISAVLRNSAYVRATEEVVNYLEGKGITIAGQDRINGQRAILTYNKRDKKGFQNVMDEWIGAIAKHDGVIPTEIWLETQLHLDKNSMKLPRVGTSEVALLSGIIRCKACGAAMGVTYGRKRNDGKAPHYYTCDAKKQLGAESCQNPNAIGTDIDNLIVNRLVELSTSSKDTLIEELKMLKNNYSEDSNVLDDFKKRKAQLMKEINNLIGEISKSAIASKYILPQIEAMDEKINELDKEINRLEKEKEADRVESEGLSLVVSNILSFSEAMSGFSNKERKHFLQSVVDKVYWDGFTGDAFILPLMDPMGKKKLNYSNSGELSHFYSAARWTGY